MKTFEQFRRDWILDPSKEMIVEKEIVVAYKVYKAQRNCVTVVAWN